MENNSNDPYLISNQSIKEPPVTLGGRIKYLGPGFILSAAIVGSGELIATTTLGAKAGFITFWVILVSCLVKVVVQLEFGKHTIMTGKTAMQLLDGLPGVKIGSASWSVWLMLLLMLVKLLQLGGIVGGVAIILAMAVPGTVTIFWSYIIAIVVALLIFRGYYKVIEKTSIVMIGLFTVFTALCLYFVQFTPFSFGWSEIISGLTFRLPKETVAVAIGAFGITGMSGEEIIYYNYWCLEKGYARYTGVNDGSQDWERRAKGWIRTMRLDAISAMFVYTIVTALFYLLGASVLYAQGEIPEGYQMVETLSAIYTQTLGDWARVFFMVGSFLILFSTLFAALASWTRLFPDIFGQIGWLDFNDYKQRKKYLSIFAWVFPFLWATLFVFIELPVAMIISGGIVGSVLLLLVVFSVIHLRYFKTIEQFKPAKLYDILLWVSIFSILLLGVYGLIRLLF